MPWSGRRRARPIVDFEKGAALTLYAVALFLGAFLVFQVQPLLGKLVLPVFGGASAVWMTCLMFFQTALLAGYAYAHLLSRLAPRTQAWTHGALLATALLFLPLETSLLPADLGADDPTLSIVRLLATTIGVPFLLLSATSPLLQLWFARLHPDRSPYRLYAMSNCGSLLALVSYPTLVEPNLSLRAQAWIWSAGVVALVAFLWACAASFRRAGGSQRPIASEAPPSALVQTLWLALATAGSVLLLGTTNHLCQNVAPVPFLWILPLALYLLSFILCFESDRFYARNAFGLAFVAAILGTVAALRVRVDARAARAGRDVLVRALRGLHGLPRRARAVTARPRASHPLLPHGRGGGRARRSARDPRRAARLSHVLGALRRARPHVPPSARRAEGRRLLGSAARGRCGRREPRLDVAPGAPPRRACALRLEEARDRGPRARARRASRPARVGGFPPQELDPPPHAELLRRPHGLRGTRGRPHAPPAPIDARQHDSRHSVPGEGAAAPREPPTSAPRRGSGSRCRACSASERENASASSGSARVPWPRTRTRGRRSASTRSIPRSSRSRRRTSRSSRTREPGACESSWRAAMGASGSRRSSAEEPARTSISSSSTPSPATRSRSTSSRSKPSTSTSVACVRPASSRSTSRTSTSTWHPSSALSLSPAGSNGRRSMPRATNERERPRASGCSSPGARRPSTRPRSGRRASPRRAPSERPPLLWTDDYSSLLPLLR